MKNSIFDLFFSSAHVSDIPQKTFSITKADLDLENFIYFTGENYVAISIPISNGLVAADGHCYVLLDTEIQRESFTVLGTEIAFWGDSNVGLYIYALPEHSVCNTLKYRVTRSAGHVGDPTYTWTVQPGAEADAILDIMCNVAHTVSEVFLPLRNGYAGLVSLDDRGGDGLNMRMDNPALDPYMVDNVMLLEYAVVDLTPENKAYLNINNQCDDKSVSIENLRGFWLQVAPGGVKTEIRSVEGIEIAVASEIRIQDENYNISIKPSLSPTNGLTELLLMLPIVKAHSGYIQNDAILASVGTIIKPLIDTLKIDIQIF